MNYHPLANQVIVERGKAIEKTEAGIFIAKSAQERPRTGIVKAVGPGARHPKTDVIIPMNVKVGDEVMFPPYSGNRIMTTIDDWIMPETDILGVVG